MKRWGGIVIILPLVLAIVLCSVSGICLFTGLTSAHVLREADKGSWDLGARWLIGKELISTNVGYELSPEELAKAKELGIDPELLSRASAVEAWADGLWGEEAGDRALYMALTSGESANCQNCGNSDACTEYHKHPALNGAAQCAALDRLLEVWKRYDIRASNPIAAKYISPDYTKVKGSKGGGALGCSQFLAGTALPHLGVIGEPFDLWEPTTAMKTMAAEVHRLGYREDMSTAEKIQLMLGWNGDRGWIARVIATAQQYAEYLGIRSGLAEVIDGYAYEQAWWQEMIEVILWMLDLLPEELGEPEIN